MLPASRSRIPKNKLISKVRLDKFLVEKNFAQSREKAQALILSGSVSVEGKLVDKVGAKVSYDSKIEVKEKSIPYVSRGGLKLEAAIKVFKIEVMDKITMDVGASTGGFTDCLLRSGACKVYAVDVGYGQLAWSLRRDPRVVVIERTNIRYIDEGLIKDRIDLATIDVSFISLTKVIPKVTEFLKEKGDILALIKPQFEVGKGEVGKGGIVRDREKHRKVIDNLISFSSGLGLEVVGVFESPLRGQKGNIEYFMYLRKRQR